MNIGGVCSVYRMRLRVFDVLDTLFLVKDPVLPCLETVGHAPQDDLGHLQSRVAQAHYNELSSARHITRLRRLSIPYCILALGASVMMSVQCLSNEVESRVGDGNALPLLSHPLYMSILGAVISILIQLSETVHMFPPTGCETTLPKCHMGCLIGGLMMISCERTCCERRRCLKRASAYPIESVHATRNAR